MSSDQVPSQMLLPTAPILLRVEILRVVGGGGGGAFKRARPQRQLHRKAKRARCYSCPPGRLQCCRLHVAREVSIAVRLLQAGEHNDERRIDSLQRKDEMKLSLLRPSAEDKSVGRTVIWAMVCARTYPKVDSRFVSLRIYITCRDTIDTISEINSDPVSQ